MSLLLKYFERVLKGINATVQSRFIHQGNADSNCKENKSLYTHRYMFITELQLVPADSNLVINLPLAISKSISKAIFLDFAFSKSFTIGDFQLPLFRIFFRLWEFKIAGLNCLSVNETFCYVVRISLAVTISESVQWSFQNWIGKCNQTELIDDITAIEKKSIPMGNRWDISWLDIDCFRWSLSNRWIISWLSYKIDKKSFYKGIFRGKNERDAGYLGESN